MANKDSQLNFKFLVPENLGGEIILIYDENCENTVSDIKGKRNYKIPDNGVMMLANKLETDIIDQEYYCLDEKWNKTKKIPGLIQAA